MKGGKAMENRPTRPFGFRDKLGYLFGDFGNDFTFILSTTILMKFYTDVMGVSAGIVGTLMMLARLVDPFTDVAMGRICDRGQVTAAVFSALAVACYLLCYGLVTERVVPRGNSGEDLSTVGQMLRSALANRALLSIIVASVVMLLAQLTMQNMVSYIYPDYYQAAAMQSLASAVMMVGMFLAAGVAKPLTNRFGKAEVSVVSGVCGAAVCLLVWLVRPGVYAYMALMALFWLFLGVFSMVSWGLVTDVIDYTELKNGVREDGSVYALYSFARKCGQALASGLSGWLLTVIGYRSEIAAGGGKQPEGVLNGIFAISSLVPAAGLLALAAVLWFWYPLHRKQVEANVAALKKKHEV